MMEHWNHGEMNLPAFHYSIIPFGWHKENAIKTLYFNDL